jgi:shikimate kinase
MKNTYVTGFIGSERYELGSKLAEEKGMELVVLDKFIEEIDGRSVMRIIMLMGEHEYRNKEYEALEELSKKEGLVVVCGDGALFDEMCAELMEQGDIVIADSDRSAEELWQNAKDDKSIPYAFMQFAAENEKRATFFKMYDQRKPIYDKYL